MAQGKTEQPSSSSSFGPPPFVLNSLLANLKHLPDLTAQPQQPPQYDRDHDHNHNHDHGHAREHENLHPHQTDASRAFRRQRSVHEILGGGHSADVLLWRKKNISAQFLTGATILWVLFEWVGCHFVSLISLLLFTTMAALFLWSNAGAFFNRPTPPVPEFQLSDVIVVDIAKALVAEINRVLSILHHISMGNDVSLFLKVMGGLFALFLFGGWFHFLTLLYIAIVGAHILPIIYEKHGDSIDEYAQKGLEELYKQYQQLDFLVFNKIQGRQAKVKKDE